MRVLSGANEHDESPAAPVGPLRNLLDILTTLVKLFDGCEVLAGPMPLAGVRDSDEAEPSGTRLGRTNVISLIEFRSSRLRAVQEIGPAPHLGLRSIA
jgi:hypothetical protein